jgi:hypothetical protein
MSSLTREKIQVLVATLKEILSIPDWKIKIEYEKFPKKDPITHEGYFATMDTRFRYKDAVITIYPDFFTENPNEQKRIIIHEMCHIITEHQRLTGKLNEESNERETSEIEDIIVKLLGNENRGYSSKIGRVI